MPLISRFMLSPYQNATFSTPVARMFSKAIGMSHFHASAWSWSSRKRGYVNRAQNIRNATSMTLANSTNGPSDVGRERVARRVEEGQRPPAEEQRGRERGERERGAELADEEEEEAEAGVLDHVAGDELGLGDGHVEGRLGQLRLRRDHEQREADELREDQRQADPTETEDLAVALELDDPLQVHRPGLHDDTDDREDERQFVRDELGRGAQRTEQRVLVRARPTAIRTPTTLRLDTASA